MCNRHCWLVLALLGGVAACGEDGAPETASVLVRATTTGDTLDADGYLVTVAGTAHQLGPNDSLTVPGLPAGTVPLALSGVAVNCRLEGDGDRTVAAQAGLSAEVAYAVRCAAARFDRIAFTRSDPLGGDPLYHMNLDGSDTVRITPALNTGGGIAWSRDGTRIAYSVGDGVSEDVFLVDPDGSDSVRLTPGGAIYRSPVWSPDGGRLALGRLDDFAVVLMGADGSGLTPLTTTLSRMDHRTSWSPDGARLAVSSDDDGDGEIYAVNLDGSGTLRLTTDPADDLEPAWSPDGSRIAFISTRTGGQRAVFVMNADGTGAVALTTPGTIYCPTWSPDGSKIAFLRDWDVWVMDADGGNPVNLTRTPETEGGCPTWAPRR